jgi:hypothetical protein
LRATDIETVPNTGRSGRFRRERLWVAPADLNQAIHQPEPS